MSSVLGKNGEGTTGRSFRPVWHLGWHRARGAAAHRALGSRRSSVQRRTTGEGGGGGSGGGRSQTRWCTLSGQGKPDRRAPAQNFNNFKKSNRSNLIQT
jgi:hypothetical protein